MAKGDHIFVDRGMYTHHGIDCGDGTVIEYGGGIKGGAAEVRQVPLSQFLQSGKLQIRQYKSPCNSPDVVVERAKSRLGEKSYNVATNNCEHFATWCKDSEHDSIQVTTCTNTASTCSGISLTCSGLLMALSVGLSAAVAIVFSATANKRMELEDKGRKK
jgi:hypothetical protein